jgi:hypothetical protein
MDGMTVATDGYLQAALDRLHAAVTALVDPVKEMFDGEVLLARSFRAAGPRNLLHHKRSGFVTRGSAIVAAGR